MSTLSIAPGTLWRQKESKVCVRVWSTGFLRVGMGRTTKKMAVFYESLHDGEVTARVSEEFLRLFQPS
jgi:hypothetical protein